MRKHCLIALTVVCAALTQQPAHAQTFAPPTMGWSSWNTYAANISDSIIRRQADAMVDNGLDTVGYKYINIDDGFFYNRDANGRLVIHPTRFPNGLRPVVDYIHSKGLKAGTYSDAGHNTCASFYGGETGGVGAGLYEHDEEDCEMYFNEMDFDFIKVDFCGGSAGQNSEHLALNEKERYTDIAKAIAKTGKKVVYNVCRWDFPGTWVCDIADSWRISQDIYASWESVKNIISQNLYLSAYCANGHYNDMDMLEVGRGLSTIEDQTHFGMWCIMSSPLLIGCDLGSISPSTRKLLGNEELIAVNQDALGLQAYVASAADGTYTLVKDVDEKYGLSRVVALYNPTDKAVKMTLKFSDVDLGGQVAVRNLMTRKDAGTYEDSYTTSVSAHGTRFLKLTAERRLMRTVYEAETAWLSAYQEIYNNQSVGTAIYVDDSNCSGGEKVGWLGKSANNDLQWKNVYVAEAGEYDLTFFYQSGESRTMNLTVNGGESQKLSCNSGSWTKVDSVVARVQLQAGENVVRLYNANAWMPDIDRMTLKAVVPDAVSAITTDDRATPIYDLKGRAVSSTMEETPKGIYISDGKKLMKR